MSSEMTISFISLTERYLLYWISSSSNSWRIIFLRCGNPITFISIIFAITRFDVERSSSSSVNTIDGNVSKSSSVIERDRISLSTAYRFIANELYFVRQKSKLYTCIRMGLFDTISYATTIYYSLKMVRPMIKYIYPLLSIIYYTTTTLVYITMNSDKPFKLISTMSSAMLATVGSVSKCFSKQLPISIMSYKTKGLVMSNNMTRISK